MLKTGRGFFAFLLGVAGVEAFACCLPFAVAQSVSESRNNKFVVGGGVAVPGADLQHSMSPTALLRIGYGYRVRRYFQADVGLDLVFGAAGINTTEQSLVGELRIRDYEYMIPFGGRAVLPIAADRLELFAGGGGAYLRYGEEAEIPGLSCYGSCYFAIPCPSCTSRGGWGLYGTVGLSIALERKRRVWFEMEARYINGCTSGRLLGNGDRFDTSDRWLNTSVNVAFRF